MKILVTGAAGFIGSTLALRLLEHGDNVIGVDNHNDYYDPSLKEARLKRLLNYPNYTHLRVDLSDKAAIENVFSFHKPRRVVNLAAQAGVRYSIENPLAYIHSNIVGFAHILEGCRNQNVEHLVYASTSSVYGASTALPFSEHGNTDHPLSLYKLPTTGLRFFTVYGPWGRPDMALFKFTKSILAGEPIQLFNHGKHLRDFTYVDDIVEGIVRVLDKPATPNFDWKGDDPDPSSSNDPWRVYNIGNNDPVELVDYVKALEDSLGRKAEKQFLPLQPGDIPSNQANVDNLAKDFDYRPVTKIEDGIQNFVNWYRSYYGV